MKYYFKKAAALIIPVLFLIISAESGERENRFFTKLNSDITRDVSIDTSGYTLGREKAGLRTPASSKTRSVRTLNIISSSRNLQEPLKIKYYGGSFENKHLLDSNSTLENSNPSKLSNW